MSWNNVIPFWILMVEAEEHQAKILCGFPDEINAGWMYSTPPAISTPLRVYEITPEMIEANKPRKVENPLASLNIDW